MEETSSPTTDTHFSSTAAMVKRCPSCRIICNFKFFAARIWSCMRGRLSQLVIAKRWGGEITGINLMGCKWLLEWGADICECSDQQFPGTFCCFLLLRSSVGPQARGCSSPCTLPTWPHGLVKLYAAQGRGCILFPCVCQYWAALKDSASGVLLSSEVNTEYFWGS